MKYSVIIPCFNEEKTITAVLQSVREQLAQTGEEFEIVVVDNGSTDSSANLAERSAAKVLKSYSQTVAGVRNDGFAESTGDIIVFIDADIIVGENWGVNLNQILSSEKYQQSIIGSHPLTPEHINTLLKYWYDGISKDVRNTHLGTGHMIMSRSVFEMLNGFNNGLISGEDFEFCTRAKQAGIPIVSMLYLVVFHEGYPNSLKEFVKREIWHGLGDCGSLLTFFQSKVAMAGLINNLLLIMLVILLLFDVNVSIVVVLILIFLNMSVVYYKFGYKNLIGFASRSIVSFFYLFGRGLSPFYLVMNKYWLTEGRS